MTLLLLLVVPGLWRTHSALELRKLKIFKHHYLSKKKIFRLKIQKKNWSWEIGNRLHFSLLKVIEIGPFNLYYLVIFYVEFGDNSQVVQIFII
jgi:hypothetical protein